MHFHYRSGLGAFVLALLALGPVNAAPECHRPPKVNKVWPPPQEFSPNGRAVSLRGPVTIITGDAKDKPTIDAVKQIVISAGGTPSVTDSLEGYPTERGTQIFIGTKKENPDASAVAKALGAKKAVDLDADGYVLAAGHHEGRPSIALNGVDKRGTFYAAQTLRQLVDGDRVPGVNVRDWPLMSIRGSIEGFYGIPWSHQSRLDHYEFYGRHKINTYIYTPKDDLKLRHEWRDLYEGDALEQLKELITTANANHVDFTYALSPGASICYSSDEDFNTTVTKFNQIRDLGVHSFYVALDDIPLEFHCEEDKQKWEDKGNWHWLAEAQTYYLNRVQKEYIEPLGLLDLETVPTNYAGSQPDPYKERFGTTLNKKIRVQWTGEGVFSDKITVESVKRALTTYVTEKMFIWDNFPVNDGKRDRLFLNPLTGRATDLYKYLLGFTSNPMIEPYASLPALANYADYMWNAIAYDADESMAAILQELAGDNKQVHEALVAFSDLNQNWPYRTPEVHSPALDKDIEAFWAGRSERGRGNDGSKPLRKRLQLLSKLPETMPRMAMKEFATDVEPWTTVASQWAKACEHLINMLDAHDKGQEKKAEREFKAAQEWIEKTKEKTVDDRNGKGEDLPNSIVPHVAEQAFVGFLGNATAIYKGE
ncbi:hyaluronoglucosaminidase [Blastomyces parvus]|uniref:Hyaluronoglucosaminidase n=1 Tax=Blastomyces parvus TaxID=2060905 RepID=A0A2B7WFI7_9EURO|nr:hyaluronoglucosaminidase [Blastomyces parvus]